MKPFCKTPKIWPASTAFIIGGGPSLMVQAGLPLSQKDPDIVFPTVRKYLMALGLDKYRVIGANSAFKLGHDLIDVAWFGDCGWFDRNFVEFAKFSGLKMHCCNRHSERPGTQRLLRVEALGLCTYPGKVFWNRSTGASAINLAFHFGVKKIVLIGFDMKFSGDKVNNWHDEHKHKERMSSKKQKWLQWNPHVRHITAFPQIAKDAKEHGIEIINANMDSEITVFPKQELEEIINELESSKALS